MFSSFHSQPQVHKVWHMNHKIIIIITTAIRIWWKKILTHFNFSSVVLLYNYNTISLLKSPFLHSQHASNSLLLIFSWFFFNFAQFLVIFWRISLHNFDFFPLFGSHTDEKFLHKKKLSIKIRKAVRNTPYRRDILTATGRVSSSCLTANPRFLSHVRKIFAALIPWWTIDGWENALRYEYTFCHF